MKHRSSSILPAKLAEGCRHFDQWRSQHQTRRRLPEHLWALATELAQEFGVSKTARILRVDYQRLKQRSQSQVFNNQPPERSTMPFREFISENIHSPVECTIECEQGERPAIRIHLKGSDWPDLTALCDCLWGPAR